MLRATFGWALSQSEAHRIFMNSSTSETTHLIDELHHAEEEAARLTEMIAMLGNAMDESRMRQLKVELRVARQRAAQLADELERAADSSSNPQNKTCVRTSS